MRQFQVSDPVTRARLELWPEVGQQLLLRAEERGAGIRAVPAIRATRQGSTTRGWLGPLLVHVKRRLLRRASPA